MLTRIPGVGRRTAERLIVELRDKLGDIDIASSSTDHGRREGSARLDALAEGRDWMDIFPGVAALKLDMGGEGIPFALRFSKSDDAVPIRTVDADSNPDAAVVAIKRVNELDYYNLGLNQLAEHVGLTAPRTLAVIRELDLQSDDEYFKQIRIGSQVYKRYSQKTIGRIADELPGFDLDDVWERNRPKRR